ncbi:YgfZ/GcvT domain-containing protein [Pararobbsia silviterrae]|uniref:CAF17-like 4Fe-4S cluster assembly/insertion protein YgfZ n=1 Tax=Pararobbsia silviterrae TaxID=1792498 RepID=UPI003B82DA57
MSSPSDSTAPLSTPLPAPPSAVAEPTAADFDHAIQGAAFAVLDQFAIVDATGADAASFLHSQLTNDIESLASGAARLAGYCTPKGRLLASLLVWRTGETIRMLASADLAAGFVKRLSMFVLRAKAKLADVTASHVAVGIVGDATQALSAIFPALPDTVHGVVTGEAGDLIRVPDAVGGRARFVWIAARAQFDAHAPVLAGAVAQVPAAIWDWLDIHAGEPRITAPTLEQFVPQMINFEVLGGVNFKKGCYPGQEIVARSQYRSTIKRRAMLVHVNAPARAGEEIFDASEPEQPCGMVVNAAPARDGGADCLVEIKLASIDSPSIHLGSANGPALAFLAQPYTLPTEQ